jgi:alkylation response protein AidB-like acyl-CoA dehydrogenase
MVVHCPVTLAVMSSAMTLPAEARGKYMYGRAATIYGGSNEVQRNVIAKAVLGL